MFFCDKCNYLFNITKDVKNKQIGGKINKSLTSIFNKYENNEPIEENDLEEIKGKMLLDDDRYENMTKKEQKKFISWIKNINKDFFNDEEIEDNNNKAYFICKYCKNSKPIKPGTLIYSKNYNLENSIEPENYDYVVYDHSLARTKTYNCKNKECETHQNPTIKEAILTKNSSDQLVYICSICLNNWINII